MHASANNYFDVPSEVGLNGGYRHEQNYGDAPPELIADSAGLRATLMRAEIVAPTNSSVLILGETGTGKELIARMVHARSPRHSHAFVKVNCAAIPLGLLESELFGHERGAFTGALSQRVGRFELADKGTLFLDEVGDIPLELQPKLLRVLQEQEFERLGSTRTRRTDVRVIAATHRNLNQMVDDGTFRVDLFYRLKVFPVTIPPLRERLDDVPHLVRHFTAQYARQMNKCVETIGEETIDMMMRYSWPGNVRELQHFVERAVILTQGSILDAPLNELCAGGDAIREPVTLEEAERYHILRTLQKTNGQLAGAAAILGVPRSTLFYKVRRLGIALPGRARKAATAC
jgi:formate hydrogenlyase transcriptional activator